MKKKEKQMMEEEKNELAMRLLSVNDRSMIKALKVVFDELMGSAKKQQPISIAQYDSEIGEVVKESENEKSIFNEELIKELDLLRKQHRAGKLKTYSVAEVRARAYGKLKK